MTVWSAGRDSISQSYKEDVLCSEVIRPSCHRPWVNNIAVLVSFSIN